MSRKDASRRHGLGPFVLVMRELQVQAAAVEIEVVAQESEDITTHRCASRSAFAEGRGPTRLPRFGVLPQREIEWRTLFADGFDAVTGAKAVEWLAGQESVVGTRETSNRRHH